MTTTKKAQVVNLPESGEAFALQARRDILTMSFLAQVGYIPSALSMVDYLSILFRQFLRPDDSRIILGKPYGAQAYYAVFAGCGWIPSDWNRYGSTDPHWRYIIGREHPLIDYIDDTMGNTLSVACGIAMAFQGCVYVNISDAAFQEGTIWEAALFAGARGLRNLVMTVDNNHMQVLGNTRDILDVEPLAQRLECFGWRVFSSDGHDLQAIEQVLEQAFSPSDAPTVVIFDTIKGRGVSWMEDSIDWHYRKLTQDEYQRALGNLV